MNEFKSITLEGEQFILVPEERWSFYKQMEKALLSLKDKEEKPQVKKATRPNKNGALGGYARNDNLGLSELNIINALRDREILLDDIEKRIVSNKLSKSFGATAKSVGLPEATARKLWYGAIKKLGLEPHSKNIVHNG